MSTVPSALRAYDAELLAAMPAATTPGTWMGVARLVVVPSPNWPSALPPQAHTVPSFFSARL